MPARAVTAQPAGDDLGLSGQVWRICAVVMIGAIMSILDTTIVTVALSKLGHELDATIAEIQWTVTGYMLALAAVIPMSGWAARRFGAKQMYLASVIVFTAGSVLCGLSSSTTELILFRVVQGLGGGMIVPIAQMVMADAAGPKRMGRVMGVLALPVMLAPIFGPALGGLIVDSASWRWIFYVNVPIGVAAVALAWRVLPRAERSPAGRLDVRGLVLMAAGLPVLTYGLAEIGARGDLDIAKVILPCLVGALLIAAFARHALRVTEPLLDLRLYRKPTFAAASTTMFCTGAALFGGLVLLPLYWQDIRHYSVVDTGLLTGPQGIGMALVMPVAGRLADRLGGGRLALVGAITTTITTIPFGLVGPDTSIPWLSAAMVLRGGGLALTFIPSMSAAFASLERFQLTHATPQLNVIQRVGGSTGAAVVAVVLQRGLDGAVGSAARASAYSTAFAVTAGMSALAAIPAVALARAERAARSTPRRRAEPTPELESSPV